MDVKDWLKIAAMVSGVVLVGLGVTVGAAWGAILVPAGVGLVTATAVKSTGVTGLIEKAKSIPPGPK